MNEPKAKSEESQRKGVKKSGFLEKMNLCKKWDESGLSKNAFCKKEGIKLPTFCGWYKRLNWQDSAEDKTKEQAALCEVKIVGASQPSSINAVDSLAIELNILGKVEAKIYLKEQQVGFLLKELINAATAIR